MKKFMCITIALAMLLAFASCAGSGDNNDSQDGTSESNVSSADNASVADTSSEDDIGSQSSQSGADDSSDGSNPDDSSVAPKPDDSSVAPPPDDSSVSSEPNSAIVIPPISADSSLVDVFNAVSNNDILNSDTIMAKVLKYYFDGKEDMLYFRNFSSGDSKLFDIALDDLSAIDSAICVEPFVGPVEYCCYLMKLKDGANAEDIKAKVLSAMDKSRWECVTAEKAVVIDSGSIILALMASETETDAYIKAFKEVMESAGTVLSK